jgi:heme exporter protein B
VSWFRGALAVLGKDLRSEARTRAALNAIVLFTEVTLAAVSFSLGGLGPGPEVHSSLLWTVLLFASMAGLSRSFVAEEERGTSLALRLTTSGAQVFLGKFLFNLLLLALLDGILIPLFQILLPLPPSNWALLVVGLGLGSLALAASTTLVAAIVALGGVKGALFTVLCFPILIPVLVAGVGATRKAMDQRPLLEASTEVQLLVSYAGIMITVSLLLFDHVWRE